MIRKSSPLVGVLLFLAFAFRAQALDSPREVIIELDRAVTISEDAGRTITALPDLDAFLERYPGVVTRYALDLPANRHQQFRRFLIFRLPENEENRLTEFKRDIARLSSVRWSRPNRLQQIHFYPDDPFYPDQWGLERVYAEDAWDETLGSAEIPIAIIDTGCEMDHPDLVSSIWTNGGEIAGNGVDDDDNGFIDDVYGWDFVDAPTLPTGGDYLTRDNDPSDEMGHGTAVAGICGAAIDNGLGVAGLAPECPLMILRAGNMNGFLQEDDVASAILYAMDNGARVINMSFGDTQASPMLESVINYATQAGIVIVASAGNNGNTEIIYPAVYSTTLCVGACNEQGNRATFSSYGTSLDILAPGTNILSTVMEAGYEAFQGGNGTSYSAPFASATAGLILSLHPNWGPPEVTSVLKSSAEDRGSPGWDPEYGQGILRADKAVLVNDALVAQISTPLMGQGFAEAETLVVGGTASGVYMDRYEVLAAIGTNPTVWDTVRVVRNLQIIDGLLALWINQEPLDSAYTIRLIVTDIFGNTADDQVVVYFDPSPPVISDISLVPILDADRPSYLLSFQTDDLTTGKVWLRGTGGVTERWISQPLSYQSAEHTMLLGKDLPFKEFEYYIWVENSGGLTDSTDILGIIDLRAESIATNYFTELPQSEIPAGYLFEEVTDLDEDGFLEVWSNILDASGGRSDLRVYEATPSWSFSELELDFGLEIPKSIGDSDADGLDELLTLYGGRSKIFEADASPGFPLPSNVVWSDSGDIWGAKLMDLDPDDDHGEVLLVSGSVYKLYSNWGGGQLSYLQDLPNPFNPPLSTMPPYCRLNDYDSDGFPDLLFGDYEGNLFIYERNESDVFQVSWTHSLPLLDTGEFLSDGDYNGDGMTEFAALAHTETTLSGEHQADTRYWALYVFNNEDDDEYVIVDTLYFFGAENPSDFASGINSGDVYGDPEPEILLCLYPDFYVVDWDTLNEEYTVIWYYPQCLSSEAAVGDFNGNGHNEILFSDGATVRTFEAVGDWSYWLPPPLNFKAEPKPDRVNLSWSAVQGADEYNLYRGASPDSLELYIDTLATSFTDFDVIPDSTYYYAISTVDLSAQILEGPLSVPIIGIPNDPPIIPGDTAVFVPPNFVTVRFNEAMGPSLLDVSKYWIANSRIQPTSVVSDAGGTRAVLSFDATFQDSTYRLIIHEIYDLQGSAFSTLVDTLRFTVYPAEQRLPYLATAFGSVGQSKITLEFSDPMNTTELAAKTNYSITVDPATGVPSGDPISIASADPDTVLHNVVYLQIKTSTPIGPLGKIYRVTAKNLHNTEGLPIDTTHNTATLNFFNSQLNNVFVYPNPYKTGLLVDGQACVVFANLPQDTKIRILNLEGIVIKTIETSGNVTGGVRWYLDNDNGEKVGSGVYLYYVTGAGDTFWGKLAVVR